MSDVWTAVLLVGAGTIVLKASGPVLLGGRAVPDTVAPDAYAPDRIWAASADRLHTSADLGATWRAVGRALPERRSPPIRPVGCMALVRAQPPQDPAGRPGGWLALAWSQHGRSSQERLGNGRSHRRSSTSAR